MARPTKYDPTFHPESYLKLCKEGKTRSQIAAEWGVDRDTLLNWSKDESKEEFFGIVKKGEDLRESWWIEKGKELINGDIPKGNATAYVWLTKQICKWSDKQEIEHSGESSIEVTTKQKKVL